MKQLSSVFSWNQLWCISAVCCLVGSSSFCLSSVDAAPNVAPHLSQEALLQQQQKLEQELDQLNIRLQDVRNQLKALRQTPSAQQTETHQQAETQLQEEEAVMLDEISIVSTRILKRPEGLTVSSTPQSETDSQPTRTMKESLESLPGVGLRQALGALRRG